MSKQRDISIDRARALAIFLMIPANTVPALTTDVAYWARLLFSSAAPIFVTLAGAMVARAVIMGSRYGFTYYLQRGLFLVGVASVIDLFAGQYVPLIGFDVLYLLGISMPLLYLLAQRSVLVISGVMLAIFAITLVLQANLTYTDKEFMIHLGDPINIDFLTVMKFWFFDGWFPLFPWFGFAASGLLIGHLRWGSGNAINTFNQKKILPISLGLMILGVIVMQLYPSLELVRDGYQELFYPVSIGFMIFVLGLVTTVIGMMDMAPKFFFFKFIEPLGESSLFVYLVHCFWICRIYFEYFPKMTLADYGIAVVLLLGSMILASYQLRKIRPKYPNLPKILKWTIG